MTLPRRTASPPPDLARRPSRNAQHSKANRPTFGGRASFALRRSVATLTKSTLSSRAPEELWSEPWMCAARSGARAMCVAEHARGTSAHPAVSGFTDARDRSVHFLFDPSLKLVRATRGWRALRCIDDWPATPRSSVSSNSPPKPRRSDKIKRYTSARGSAELGAPQAFRQPPRTFSRLHASFLSEARSAIGRSASRMPAADAEKAALEDLLRPRAKKDSPRRCSGSELQACMLAVFIHGARSWNRIY